MDPFSLGQLGDLGSSSLFGMEPCEGHFGLLMFAVAVARTSLGLPLLHEDYQKPNVGTINN